jgi:hypothetical protein
MGAIDPAGAEAGVEDVVVARERLAAVLEGLRQLRPTDRELLIATVRDPAVAGDAGRPDDAGRTAVARHRARIRLARVVGGVGAIVGWLVRRTRVTAPALMAAAVVCVLVLLPRSGEPTSSRPAPVRSPALSAAQRPARPETSIRRAAISPTRTMPPRVAPFTPGAPTPMRTVLLTVGSSRAPAAQLSKRPMRPGDPLVCFTPRLHALPAICAG